MINYSTELSTQNNPFEMAEIGDKFCVIEYSPYNKVPRSVLNYEVIKVGKRDVKCVNKQGATLIVKTRPCMENPYAYKCGGDEAVKAVAKMQRFNRQIESHKLIEGRNNRNLFDDELMSAIEAWAGRMSK